MRALVATRDWSARWPLRALQLFKAAIVLWLALNLLPIGIAQLAAVVDSGHGYARSRAFYDSVTVFQWLRLVGDFAFVAGGVIVFVDLVVSSGTCGRRPSPTGCRSLFSRRRCRAGPTGTGHGLMRQVTRVGRQSWRLPLRGAE